MNSSRRGFLLSAAAWTGLPSGYARSSAPKKSLLVDSRVVESVENAHLALGVVAKHAGNPLFGEEHEWEARFDNLSPNVIWDDEKQLYRCWYSPFIVDQRTTSTPREKRASQNYMATRPAGRGMGVCYAYSEDGIRWTKPSLGRVDFNGSTSNNLVVRKQAEAGVFKDPRDPDPARRYKMTTRLAESMAVRFSPDGIDWSEAVLCPEIESPGDTHNNALWVPELERYVLFTRLRSAVRPGVGTPANAPEDIANRMARSIRTVGRSESTDFIHWTKAAEVFRGLEPTRQTYAMPVFPYAGIYLGLVAVFNTEADTVDCELAWSPDTFRWERVCGGTPFIPRGKPGSYDCGCIYGAASPVLKDGKLQIYYLGANGFHTSWREGSFNLARLDVDHFAGYKHDNCSRPGRIRTRAAVLDVSELKVTADCGNGSLVVTAIDSGGRRIARSKPIHSNAIGAQVEWSDVADWQGVLNKPLQLDFELRGSQLFSFSTR
jgi:hypothetical protein